MIPLAWTLTLAAILFSVGVAGLVLRRNILVMLLCIELMVNAANLVLVASSFAHGLAAGQALVVFVIGIEAAELAAALAVITVYHRLSGNVDMGLAESLRD